MQYPTRGDIADKLLILICQNGGHLYQMKSCDTYDPLADILNLDPVARRITRDEYFGDGLSSLAWHNQVQRARQYLVDAGHLSRTAPRGLWCLTEQGVKHAQWLLRLRDTVRISLQDFKEWKARREAILQNQGA